MKQLIKFPVGRYTSIMSLGILVLSLISISIPGFAQQSNFVASLSSQTLSPSVNTEATGRLNLTWTLMETWPTR